MDCLIQVVSKTSFTVFFLLVILSFYKISGSLQLQIVCLHVVEKMLPYDKTKALDNLKAFADNKTNVALMIIFVFVLLKTFLLRAVQPFAKQQNFGQNYVESMFRQYKCFQKTFPWDPLTLYETTKFWTGQN